MKKFVKFVSLVIAICLLFTLFVGCGENVTNSSNDISSTVSHDVSSADNNSSDNLSENVTSTENSVDSDITSSDIIPDGYKDITSFLTYTVSNGCTTIIDCDTSVTGKVKIPSKIDGYPVVCIGKKSFEFCDKITSIIIPEGIKKIETEAFYNCYNLASVSLPNSLETLEKLIFRGCDFTSFHIPKGVKVIDANIFDLNMSLTKITVDSKNPYFYSKNNCIVETANKRVVSAANYATIPDETKIIGDYAFYWNLAKSFNIPNGVEKIGDYAFSQCNALTKVVIPNNVKEIGKYCFSNTHINNITLSENLIEIPEGAFNSVEITSITIPNKVKSIRKNAFKLCRVLSSISIPKSVTEINEYAFSNTGLETVDLPGVAIIGSYAFEYCSKLSKIRFSNTLQSIGEYSFSNCTSLVEVDLPYGVSNIENHAFDHCISLAEITFPDSITNIGDYVFYCCGSLEKFVVPNGVTVYRDFFYECDSLIELTVPDSIVTYSCNYGLYNQCKNVRKLYFFSEEQMKLFKKEFSINQYMEFILIS